jgi:5'-3' exonuclease
MRSVWKKFDADHIVICTDGRSWRKDVYRQYKANRAKIRLSKSLDEQEEDQIFFDALNDFENFLKNHTNVTYLHHPQLEADDLISGFIQAHEHDLGNQFTIVSTDTDYQQLISSHVQLYDGVQNKLTTIEGFFDDKGKPFKGKEHVPDPEYMLFEKCVRGDKGDNIEAAYPGARSKGTKNKVGILEAFENRHQQGWEWTNFMMQTWVDLEDQLHVVKDDYERNVMLIGLRHQPEHIKQLIRETVELAMCSSNDCNHVGIHFLRFCGKHELVNIAKFPDDYVTMLNSKRV